MLRAPYHFRPGNYTAAPCSFHTRRSRVTTCTCTPRTHPRPLARAPRRMNAPTRTRIRERAVPKLVRPSTQSRPSPASLTPSPDTASTGHRKHRAPRAASHHRARARARSRQVLCIPCRLRGRPGPVEVTPEFERQEFTLVVPPGTAAPHWHCGVFGSEQNHGAGGDPGSEVVVGIQPQI